jgi:hypothetical protein
LQTGKVWEDGCERSCCDDDEAFGHVGEYDLRETVLTGCGQCNERLSLG